MVASSMQLDIEDHITLQNYLRRTGRIGPGEEPAMRTLAGGVSNRTVLVERSTGEAWVLKQALSKLRVAVDWFSGPERIHREAEGIRRLAELAPPGSIVPLIFEDHGQHLLAMAAVPQPHENWKTMLLRGQLDRAHVEQFARLLGTVHRHAWLERQRIAPAFADRSFFESLRLEPYYSYTAEQVPPASPFLNRLIEETRATHQTLVHGDYSPKNILVHRDRLILLDHEVIHFGDPAFDVGFSLTHLLGKAHHLVGQRNAFADAARLYWEQYRDTLGNVAWLRNLEARAVRHTMACLLARVAGRSPLEYLGSAERVRQRAAILTLIQRPPRTIADLVDAFLMRIEDDVDR
jgi:aminoglycoside phosphotransferase (APT) family kinase protein